MAAISPFDRHFSREPCHDLVKPDRAPKQRQMGALPASPAEGVPAGARGAKCHPDGRAHLGAGGGECVVSTAAARSITGLLDEPSAGSQGRRALAPPPPAA